MKSPSSFSEDVFDKDGSPARLERSVVYNRNSYANKKSIIFKRISYSNPRRKCFSTLQVFPSSTSPMVVQLRRTSSTKATVSSNDGNPPASVAALVPEGMISPKRDSDTAVAKLRILEPGSKAPGTSNFSTPPIHRVYLFLSFRYKYPCQATMWRPFFDLAISISNEKFIIWH